MQSEQVWNKAWISTYPSNYIPAGARVFIAIDRASPDGDCSAKGFFDPKTGEYHIQEVIYNKG